MRFYTYPGPHTTLHPTQNRGETMAYGRESENLERGLLAADPSRYVGGVRNAAQSQQRADPLPIHSALMSRLKLQDHLHERISELNSRLAQVLKPVATSAQPPKEAGRPTDCEGNLACAIESANFDLSCACNQIDSMIARLEL